MLLLCNFTIMFLHFQNNNPASELINKKHALIDEQTSPLQRIMWIYNADEPERRSFENNICAFHIGNGYFLSVAHNLKLQAGFVKSMDEDLYKKEIYTKLDGAQSRLMDQHYFTDDYTRKKYLNNNDPANLQAIAGILKQKRFDTRWVTLAEKNICNPYVVFQFKNNLFYDDHDLTRQMASNRQFYEPAIQKHTFLAEVALVKAFYSADIALYKMVNAPEEVIKRIPAIEIDLNFIDEPANKLYCLQSSPGGPSGRLLNEAVIDGILDHFTIFPEDFGGNYLFEGYRYLLKGYTRFGSSGAPYIIFDDARGCYVANAIQSELSGIQMSIKNDREGNIQYVNAIASPLYIIRDELQGYLK